MPRRVFAALAVLFLVAGTRAEAGARHRPIAQARHHQARNHETPSRAVPQDPRYGYLESPYDPTYRGPGWQIFALQHEQEQRAGVLHEIAPDAKISATGVVVGGY